VDMEIHVAGCVSDSSVRLGGCIVEQLSESLGGSMCAV
jgi:hypothetical protein